MPIRLARTGQPVGIILNETRVIGSNNLVFIRGMTLLVQLAPRTEVWTLQAVAVATMASALPEPSQSIVEPQI